MKRLLVVAILGAVVAIAAGCEDPVSLGRRQAAQAQAAALRAEEARAIAQVKMAEAQAEMAAAQAAKASTVVIGANDEIPSDGIHLALDGQGKCRLDGEELAADAIEARIKELTAEKPLPVVIAADAACPYASVISLIQACQKAGAEQIHLKAAAE